MRPSTDLRNPRKFSTLKILGYIVVSSVQCTLPQYHT